MKIGVLSDTHNYLPKKAIHYLEGCDEIWHGGDIGSINVLEKLEQICHTRAVWGNIDNEIIKRETEEYLIFKIKNFKILIIHIAGKINSYNRKTRDLILENKPNLLVCGHSHILKIARDKKHNLISKKTESLVWSRHILDSAQLVKFIDYTKFHIIADFGSGAGLPGVLLGIFSSDYKFHVKLYEKSPVKRQFLNRLKAELGLKYEVLDNIYNHTIDADIITFRAFKKIEEIINKK